MKLETKVQWANFKEKAFSKIKLYYSILWRKFIQEKVLIAKILGIFLILFVAHNVRFDYGFVKHELKEHGLPFSAKQLCTVKLSRQLFPRYRKHSLAALIERFGFSFQHRHRAFDDAHVLWQFYQMLHQQFDVDKLSLAIESIQAQPTFPKDLEPGMVESLPESPGVYQFF
jgi:DNA polymerase-3 subunit epsilon